VDSNPGFSLERLSFGSSGLPWPTVSKHGIQDREELSHGGDDRDFARTARGHEAMKERPDHGVVLDRRNRGHVQDAPDVRTTAVLPVRVPPYLWASTIIGWNVKTSKDPVSEGRQKTA
jgi:hypothetical protein